MESYLQGQDLWELISGTEVEIPEDTPQNVEHRRKWKIKCGKAMYALRTSISKDHIDHIREMDTPKKVWDTLEKLFTKRNTARLQYLENELAGTNQGNLSIPEYFMKIKSLCNEISELEPDDPIKEARMRRYLVRGLRKEFMPFTASVQGWANQPSIVELENLLSNQEALVKQMSSTTSASTTSAVEDVLFTKDKGRDKSTTKHVDNGKQQRYAANSDGNSKTCHRCGKHGHIKKYCRVKVVCQRCGKSGHIKPNCRVKLADENDNAVHEEKDDQLKWEQCFSIEVGEQHAQGSNDSIDYKRDWIIDSGCSHHATGNASVLSGVRPHQGRRVIVTADNSLHPVVKEGHLIVKADKSVSDTVALRDVYHAPGLKKNLASVSQITDSGRYVLFGPHNVQILTNFRSIDADVLSTGERKDSLYVLSASEAYVEKTSRNASFSLWHARLGHVGYQLLQQISIKRLLEGVPLFKKTHTDIVCSGCQYGKSRRLPFQNSTNRASSLF